MAEKGYIAAAIGIQLSARILDTDKLIPGLLRQIDIAAKAI